MRCCSFFFVPKTIEARSQSMKKIPLTILLLSLLLSSCASTTTLNRTEAQNRLYEIQKAEEDDTFALPTKARIETCYQDVNGKMTMDISLSTEGYIHIQETDQNSSVQHHNEMFIYLKNGYLYDVSESSSGKSYSKTLITSENEAAARSSFTLHKDGFLRKVSELQAILSRFEQYPPATETYSIKGTGDLEAHYSYIISSSSFSSEDWLFQNNLFVSFRREQGDDEEYEIYHWGESVMVYPDLSLYQEVAEL